MQLTISNIRLYEMLRNKIGQEEAEAFIQMLDNKLDEMANSTSFEITTNEDATRLEIKISDFKTDIIKRLVATSIGVAGILIPFIKLVH